jgi:hypothetical protein
LRRRTELRCGSRLRRRYDRDWFPYLEDHRSLERQRPVPRAKRLVIDYLTQSGWMRAAQLYESPFTDFSPRGVEGVFNSAQVTQLLSVLDNIRQAAAAS